MEHAQHAPKLEVDMQNLKKNEQQGEEEGGGGENYLGLGLGLQYRTGELGLKDFFCFHE